MRKPTSFFVSTLSIFVFLSLTFAACGSSVPFTKTQATQASSYHANYPGGAGPQHGAVKYVPPKVRPRTLGVTTVHTWCPPLGYHANYPGGAGPQHGAAQYIPTYRAPAPSPTGDPVNPVYALAWSPTGTELATGGKNGVIQLWTSKNKTLLLTAEQRFGEVYTLAWSPAGTRLAFASQDFTVHLWNPTTGQQVTAYRSAFSAGAVLALAWSPDGKYLASGSTDGIVQVWETSTHRLVLAGSNLSGGDEVTALAWSPDSKYSASAGDGGVVHLWNAATGKQVWLLHL